jgi:serine/threonine protein kinase
MTQGQTPNRGSLVGRAIGPYDISGLLGEGGMGEVYRARDRRLGRDVAIKVLPAAIADDPERRSRLDREARVLASFTHPGIATIHGVEVFRRALGAGDGTGGRGKRSRTGSRAGEYRCQRL